MYALAISGSPRKGGNTELLLKEVLTELKDAGWETELEKVGGTAIRGCIACEECFENKDNKCSIEKDKFNDIFSKMLKADALILGSPTYFAAVSADLKALLERAGYVAFANNHAFSGKIGAAVVAVRRGGATHAYDTINHMFQINAVNLTNGFIGRKEFSMRGFMISRIFSSRPDRFDSFLKNILKVSYQLHNL